MNEFENNSIYCQSWASAVLIYNYITILIEAYVSTKQVKSCNDGRRERGLGSLGRGGCARLLIFRRACDVLRRRADIFARDYWTFWDTNPTDITAKFVYPEAKQHLLFFNAVLAWLNLVFVLRSTNLLRKRPDADDVDRRSESDTRKMRNLNYALCQRPIINETCRITGPNNSHE